MSRANGADLNLDGVRGEGREIATAGEPGRRSKPTSEDTRHPVCAECGSVIASRRRSKRQLYCSIACKQRAFRGRQKRYDQPARYSTSGQPDSVTVGNEYRNGNNGQLRQKSRIQSASLFWVKVNEVTFKLTDGELSLTPACHGKWGGYKTERALAWVIEVGWPFSKSSWYARCGAQSYGPTTQSVAKRAAESFLNGAPLPQDRGARASTGSINLHAVPVRSDEISDGEWIDWPPDQGAP